MRRSNRLLFTDGSRSMYGEAAGATAAATAVLPTTGPTPDDIGAFELIELMVEAGTWSSGWSGVRRGRNGSGRTGVTLRSSGRAAVRPGDVGESMEACGTCWAWAMVCSGAWATTCSCA